MTSLASTLFERLGWTPEYLAAINDPSHPPLRDLDRLSATLHDLHETGTAILVMPDFDTDGVTSGIIAYAGLAQLGFNVDLYLPDYAHGHDITREAVAEMIVQHPDARVVLTTDAGTNSHDGIGFAAECGLRVLVTDHHLQLPSPTPLRAEVIVNPYRLDETYPHPDICGAHVIYQALLAYAGTHAPNQLSYLRRLALFAGLGTVADVMPLHFENRDLVRRSVSLARLAHHPDDYRESALSLTIRHELERGLVHPVYADAFAGMGQLLQTLTGRDKIRGELFREDLYGFYIAPAINSARRILSDGRNAFRFLLGSDPAARQRAIDAVLDDNEHRKQLVAAHVDRLHDTAQPFAPLVWLTDAPKGMRGLLASKLCEQYGLACAVVHLEGDQATGSARAPMGIDIVTGFSDSDGISAVGHAQACGVFARAEMLPVMAGVLTQLNAVFAAKPRTDEQPLGLRLGDHPEADTLAPDPDDLLDLIDKIAAEGPFGHGFPEPVHEVVLDPERTRLEALGKAIFDDNGEEISPAGRHTRITSLNSGLKLVWWNSADQRKAMLDDLAGAAGAGAKPVWTFLVTLQSNNFLGNVRPQAMILSRLT